MRIPVLDHGYVQFVESWGRGLYAELKPGPNGVLTVEQDDFEVGIIEAARQSTQGSFRGWESDEKLLKYLYNNNHATPFEFAGMVVEVQAPIFVFREWHRHRTQSYNEMSARYEPLPDLYYIPTLENLNERGSKTSANKQEVGIAPYNEENGNAFINVLEEHYRDMEKFYKESLRRGIPKELARLSMPVGHYSRMRASANLRNWLAFLTLRTDERAQWETRQYALAVEQLIAQNFPRTHRLFVDRRERAV